MIKQIKFFFYKIIRKIFLKSLSEKYGKGDYGILRILLLDIFSSKYIAEDDSIIERMLITINPALKIAQKNKSAIRNCIFEACPEIGNLKFDGRHILLDSCINVKKGENVKIYSPHHIYDCTIGDYTYIAQNPYISIATIGKFCSIGPNLICGWGIHPLNGISTHPMFFSTLKQNGMTLSSENKVEERKHITIGNDVFIGANVTILDGISIGDGAVIGAGAVVSKDIPPYAVAVGCPIKVIRYRFSEDLCKRLHKIKWWNFDLKHLKDVETYIFNVNEFVEKYENTREFLFEHYNYKL